MIHFPKNNLGVFAPPQNLHTSPQIIQEPIKCRLVPITDGEIVIGKVSSGPYAGHSSSCIALAN